MKTPSPPSASVQPLRCVCTIPPFRSTDDERGGREGTGRETIRAMFSSAVEQLALLERREVSSRELVDTYAERIEAHTPSVNAVVALDADAARAEAAEVD